MARERGSASQELVTAALPTCSVAATSFRQYQGRLVDAVRVRVIGSFVIRVDRRKSASTSSAHSWSCGRCELK